MGRFNFRLFAAIALCLAVVAFASPAYVEKRDLNVGPIISALSQLSTDLTTALTAINKVQTGAVTTASGIVNALATVGNDVLNVVGTVTATAAAKALALGTSAGNVVAGDVNQIVGLVNTITAQTSALSAGLANSVVSKVIAADGVAAALIKTTVSNGLAGLNGAINTLGGIVGSTGASVLTAANALATLLQSIKLTVGLTAGG
jgi:hypothetical protein